MLLRTFSIALLPKAPQDTVDPHLDHTLTPRHPQHLNLSAAL
jgi:hypothetical protein